MSDDGRVRDAVARAVSAIDEDRRRYEVLGEDDGWAAGYAEGLDFARAALVRAMGDVRVQR